MKLTVLLALAAGFVTALLFAMFPNSDLAITERFWNASHTSFSLAAEPTAHIARLFGNIIPWLFAGPAFGAIILKLLFPAAPMLMRARAAVFLTLTMLVGPGLVVNGLLKEHWGRPRPVSLENFGGKAAFIPWYSLEGSCMDNCSFVSGEGALGFWTIAPASLVPPPWRAPALIAATAFGTMAGGFRIAVGKHFFTDVVFSAVLTILIIGLAHWLILARPGAPDDARVEAFIGRRGRDLRALGRRLWRGCANLIASVSKLLKRERTAT